jgi:hypothetical protein
MKDLINMGGITANEFNTENLQIFPNPSTEFIEIKHNLKNLKSIEILTLNGQKIKEISPSSTKLDIKFLTSGTYFLKLIGENESKTLAFIKN